MAPKKKTPAKPKATKTPEKKEESPNVQELYGKIIEGNEVMNDEMFFGFLEKELQIAPDDPVVGHIITNVMKLKKIQEITYPQFQALFQYTGTNDQVNLKNKINDLRGQVTQDYHFKSMYRELFTLYIGNHTTLDLDTASLLWGVYITDKFTYSKEWMAYLQSQEDKENKKVHKDLWNMVLQFMYEVKDINNCTQDDGWPIFLDNFVEFVKNK